MGSIKIVYDAKRNKLGLLIDQFVLWYETCYYRPIGGTIGQNMELESMEEFTDQWSQIGDL